MFPASNNPVRSLTWASHLVGATLLALFVWGSVKLVFEPLRIEREQLEVRAEQLQTMFQKSSGVERQRRQLQQELQDLQRTILKTQGRLSEPLSDQQHDQLLREAAAEAGLEELSLDFRPPEKTATHGQGVVEFAGSGSYASICQFLAAAAQLPRVTKVAELHITSDLESPRNRLHGRFIWYFEVESNDKEENRGVR